jgi:glycosyltransferase involved in cell wall biosynthesis
MIPLVSIALITYNGERFLRQQLDSIFNQTYKNIEVIAVDDCSNDGTISILEEYRKTHDIRMFVNRQNIGYLRNFENAVSRCRGEYIAPADQDDIWLPNKIEILIKGINSSSLACSNAILIDQNGAVFSNSAMAYSNFAPASGKAFMRFVFSNFVIGCTTLISRELVQHALPIPEGEKYHDWWFALVASTMNGISYIKEPLLMYRQHATNTIGMKKDAPIIGKLIGFLYSKSDKTWFAMQEKRLLAISRAPQLNDNQKSLVLIAHKFYKNRLEPGPHFRAFRIACRYYRSIFPWNKGFFRFKAVIGCFFK